MRILIATPLYPPEVAPAAAYAKELARRLAENHEVAVLAYVHLPETLPGVRVVTIEKRQPRLARLRSFRAALALEAARADAVVALNGASVELPLLFGTRAPVIFCIADANAHARAGILERLARVRARAVVANVPSPKPEILPFADYPVNALAAWETAWQEHIAMLEKLFNGN